MTVKWLVAPALAFTFVVSTTAAFAEDTVIVTPPAAADSSTTTTTTTTKSTTTEDTGMVSSGDCVTVKEKQQDIAGSTTKTSTNCN